jgi:AraC family ethanolamine operon transcriptional activator
MDTPVPLSRLCRILGLSERGLRNAFYGVHGMGPKRWLLAERLHCVRHVLSDACARPTTVTDVATDHGFFELGRFAGTYKQVFGEMPSETLRGAGGKSAARLMPDMKGHAGVESR